MSETSLQKKEKRSRFQVTHNSKGPRLKRLGKHIRKDWELYILLLPALVYLIMFNYVPIYGVQIAFRDFVATKGISGSPWVGMKHFRDFFNSYFWKRLISNTLLLNVYSILFSFPVPIILALLLNQVRSRKYKSFVQTVVYAPHFISVVVLSGMLYIFLSPTNGVINKIIEMLGGDPIYFLNESKWFRTIYVASGIWQNTGWSSILYLAALSGIDPQLYEAATLDGASRWHKIWYIDLPSILPIIVTVLIMNTGTILTSEVQKTLLLQTPGNIATSDTIGVYVYTAGLEGAQFSYTTAIGLMMNIINFIVIVSVNKFSNKASDGKAGLW